MPDSDPHPLLLRQLRRLGLHAQAAPAAAGWAALVQAVSRAYREADQDRYLLERAQEISSRELTEQAEALRLNEGRLASLLSLSSDWVWEQDAELRVTYISEGWRAATGLDPQQFIGPHRLHLDDFDASEDDRAEFRRCLERRRPFRELTIGVATAAGDKRYMRISGQPLQDEAGVFRGWRGVGSDATEATLATRRAEHMARFDALTGLPNRAMFGDALHRALGRARRAQRRCAVAFIDLDGFKPINDNLGHAAGDELLRVMARRLEEALRAGDLVARMGGDEFVMLVENAGEAAELAALARRLIGVVAAPLALEGREFVLGCSVGLAVFPDDADDEATLLRNADAAMYVAKQRGKAQVHRYTAELAEAAADDFALETDLRLALERDELRLHFQPTFRLADRALVGVEALVRWQHPTRGLLLPGLFIPLAERRGLVVALGRWVLERACAQMRAWRDAGMAVPSCAVNLSAHHFAIEHLADEVAAALARWRLPASVLEVEVTESVVMNDPVRAHRVMSALQALGVRISIDDFGTGYSSLAYLKRFPVSALKVDRSFVRGLPADGNDSAITQAVVAMATGLGLKVVAEGVETEAQLAYLCAIGCGQAQGFLLGRPAAAEELQGLLAAAARNKAGAHAHGSVGGMALRVPVDRSAES